MKKFTRTARPPTSKQTASRIPFVLGRSAFARIAAVEKIVLSRQLRDDLHRLRDASPEDRRAALAAKYGRN